MRIKILVITAAMMMLCGCAHQGQEMMITGQGADSESYLEESLQSESDFSYDDKKVMEDSGSAAKEETAETIFVYVCGAVYSPGVYELPKGSRVINALEAAGGFTEDADETYVNLAAGLEDGIKLRIPEKSEQAAGQKIESAEVAMAQIMTKAIEGDGVSTDDGSVMVNINTASQAQLKTLPGIGDGIADRIVQYRTENGNFSRIEDIMKISGIKDKLFQKIKDRITV